MTRLVTDVERDSIGRIVGILLYEEDRLADPGLPSVEAQLVNFLYLEDTDQGYGLSFGEYLGGVAMGLTAARRYYARVEECERRALWEAHVEKVMWPDAEE